MKLTATLSLKDQRVGVVSVNQLYVNRIQGGRTLSAKGLAFKRRVIQKLALEWGFTEPLDRDKEYRLVLNFYFPAVFSRGWPKKANSRFRKIDQSNFAKFFQDCVAEVTGVDDANHTVLLLTKREDEKEPRVEIVLEEWQWPEEE